MAGEMYLIRRRSAEVSIPGDVYVTGPHFSQDVYSSTKLVSEASSFTEEEAEILIRKKWSGLAPRMISVSEAEDLNGERIGIKGRVDG